MKQTQITRLQTVEAALAPEVWREVVLQVRYAAWGDQPAYDGPRYTYRVAAHQLRGGWYPERTDNNAP